MTKTRHSWGQALPFPRHFYSRSPTQKLPFFYRSRRRRSRKLDRHHHDDRSMARRPNPNIWRTSPSFSSAHSSAKLSTFTAAFPVKRRAKTAYPSSSLRFASSVPRGDGLRGCVRGCVLRFVRTRRRRRRRRRAGVRREETRRKREKERARIEAEGKVRSCVGAFNVFSPHWHGQTALASTSGLDLFPYVVRLCAINLRKEARGRWAPTHEPEKKAEDRKECGKTGRNFHDRERKEREQTENEVSRDHVRVFRREAFS